MSAELVSDVYPDKQQDVSREQPRPLAVPADVLPADNSHLSAFELVELLLKHPQKADALNREEKRQAILIPRWLAISLASYLLFSIAMIVILNTAPAEAYPHRLLPVPAASWSNGSALGLLLAYNFGLVAATGLCLPSFYFFGLLAGVRLTMLQIVGQVLRCQASSALMLVGILPIYVATVLGLVVFGAPDVVLEVCLYLGLILPFLAGLAGVRAIYRGVLGMAETMSPERRCRRECFLRRLTVSWAAVYTAVCPVMIYRVWEFLANQVA